MGSNNLYAGHGSLVKLPLLSSSQYCKASSTQLLFRTSVRRSKFLQVESFHINALPSSSNMFVLFTLLIIRLSSDGITKNQGPIFCQQSTIHATLHDSFLKQCVISYYIGYSEKAGTTAPPTVALQFFHVFYISTFLHVHRNTLLVYRSRP